jgi:hypothetical protein
MNLLELQRRMSEDVRRPLTPDFQMQTTTEEGLTMGEIAAGYVKPNGRLTSLERLEIYNRQYWFRVIGSVSEDFPALEAVLGSTRFNALVLAYLRENPSTSFTLRDLGAKLPDWLVNHPEFAAARHQLAVDVARLEWAYVEAFDGASLPPVCTADLAGIGADWRLRLQPHLQLLQLHYPVDEIVLAVRKQTPEGDIVSNAALKRKETWRAGLPRMRRSTVHLAVHRYDNSVYYRRIDREAFLLLSALSMGDSIATAISIAFARSRLGPDKQISTVQEYFAHASELGWFCLHS